MRMELVLKLIQAVVKCLKSLPILVTTLVNLKATEAWLAEHGFVHNTVQLRLKAVVRIRKAGAAIRCPASRCTSFFERNFDTGFFTTLGLAR